MPKGKIGYNQLTDYLKNKINSTKGAVGFLKSTSILKQSSESVDINIENFDESADAILVFKNSVYLEKGEDYVIEENRYLKPISQDSWEADELNPIVFNCIILKAIPESEMKINGKMITDKSISSRTLTKELLDRINSGSGSGGATNKYFGFQKDSFVTEETITSLDISDIYNSDTDMLMVFSNSTYLEQDEDYTISNDGKTLLSVNNDWIASPEEPRVFNFIVFRVECFDGSSFKFNKNSVTITKDTKIVDIGTNYNPEKDVMMVFNNSIYLEEGEDYTVSETAIICNDEEEIWTATEQKPRVFNFITFKASGNMDLYGEDIINNSITYEKLSPEINDDIKETKKNVSKLLEQIKIVKGVIIISENWKENSETKLWEYTIDNINITADTIVEVFIGISSLDNASVLKPANESFDGKVILYASEKPQSNIECDLKLILGIN